MKKSAFQVFFLPGLLLFVFLVPICLSWLFPEEPSSKSALNAMTDLHVFQAGFWLAVAFLVNRVIGFLLWDRLVAEALGRPAPKFLKDVTTVLIILAAVSIIISRVYDEPVFGLLATSGAIGVVVALALRPIILDLFMGLSINLEQPFRIGDFIRLQGGIRRENIAGVVVETTWRTTQLRTNDNIIHYIPNNIFNNRIVTNYLQPAPRTRCAQIFCLDSSVPTDRAIRVLLAGVMAVIGQSHILDDPPPKVRISGLNERGINYRVLFWTIPQNGSMENARHEVLRSCLFHMQKAGIALARPKNDTLMIKMPAHMYADATQSMRIEGLLAQVEIFHHLEQQEVQFLAKAAAEKVFPHHAIIIQQGTPGESMFVLAEGLLEIRMNHEGHSVKIRQLVPGQFFGEMSLLTGAPRSATISCLTDVVVYEIRKESLTALFQDRPDLPEKISRMVAARDLYTKKILEGASSEEISRKTEDCSKQILERIVSFFKLVF